VITANQSSTNPNVNCLEGKRCPECGSYGPFEVLVSMRVLLHDSGTEDVKDGSIWYGDDAPTKCDSCRHEGKFREFDEQPQ
jgi:rubrerythrin